MRNGSVVTRVRSWSIEGVKGIKIDVIRGPRIEDCAAADGGAEPFDFDAKRPGIVLPRCVARWAEGWWVVVKDGTRAAAETGIGGSAMPCGLVLPTARAKLVEGDCDPEMRPAALSYW